MRYFINIRNLWNGVAYNLGGLKFPNSFMITDKIMQCNLIRISFRIATSFRRRLGVRSFGAKYAKFTEVKKKSTFYDLFPYDWTYGNACKDISRSI